MARPKGSKNKTDNPVETEVSMDSLPKTIESHQEVTVEEIKKQKETHEIPLDILSIIDQCVDVAPRQGVSESYSGDITFRVTDKVCEVFRDGILIYKK